MWCCVYGERERVNEFQLSLPSVNYVPEFAPKTKDAAQCDSIASILQLMPEVHIL